MADEMAGEDDVPGVGRAHTEIDDFPGGTEALDKQPLALVVPEVVAKPAEYFAQIVRDAGKKAASEYSKNGEQIPSYVRSAINAGRPKLAHGRSSGGQIEEAQLADRSAGLHTFSQTGANSLRPWVKIEERRPKPSRRPPKASTNSFGDQ